MDRLRLPPWVRLAGRVLSGLLILLGLAGLPDDVQHWGSWLSQFDSNAWRWVFVGAGVLLFLALSFLTKSPEAPATEVSPHSHPDPPRLPMPNIVRRADRPAPPDAPLYETPPTPQEIVPAFTDEGDRIFTDATPEVLTGFYKDRMNIHAAKLAEPHLGKWITVSGPLGNISLPHRPPRWQVTFAYRPGAVTMYMWFQDKKWIDRLSVMALGRQITVVGWIDRIEFDNVQLSGCELMDES